MPMKTGFVLVSALAVAALVASGGSVAQTAPSEARPAKNWTPPAQKIRAQALSDQIMTAHPELLSVTFHGVPPGLDKVYTMFAGSYPERIGNPDDPDDIDVITKGITIVDPRWHRTKDTVKKFVVQLPLRDTAGDNVGLLVLAYKLEANPGRSETEYFSEAASLRDKLEKDIPSYASLFEPAK
jgi:hypothetical protein